MDGFRKKLHIFSPFDPFQLIITERGQNWPKKKWVFEGLGVGRINILLSVLRRHSWFANLPTWRSEIAHCQLGMEKKFGRTEKKNALSKPGQGRAVEVSKRGRESASWIPVSVCAPFPENKS